MSEDATTKRRAVLDLLGLRHAETKPDLLPAAEYALVERGWGADNIGNPTLWISGEDYRDLGEPSRITVTIEAGNTTTEATR